MIAVALIVLPLAAYIWILLRAADDERTGWDHPRCAPTHAHPYSWGGDEDTYRWLIAGTEWADTLADIDRLPTVQEPTR